VQQNAKVAQYYPEGVACYLYKGFDWFEARNHGNLALGLGEVFEAEFISHFAFPSLLLLYKIAFVGTYVVYFHPSLFSRDAHNAYKPTRRSR
jgi:hypothetical protein